MLPAFRAFLVNQTPTGQDFEAGIKELGETDLPPGEVTVKVAYSGVNYKDAMACNPNGQIIRKFPCVPGIDLAGTVVESSDSRFKAGDEVVAHGYNIGVAHHGGFAEYARVPSAWTMPLPQGLNSSEAMVLGTAGFTAALSIYRMEVNGLKPQTGPVLVTGATGGVGSLAISMLSNLGYEVAASTGKESEHDYLKELGASQILGRAEVSAESSRAMEKERWAGSVDSVGGTTLAYLVRTTKTGGSVAACGLTGGSSLATTVYPFILRGVGLLGIDSVNCPMELRQHLWQRMGGDLKPKMLDKIVAREISLDDLPAITRTVLDSGVRGRFLVKL